MSATIRGLCVLGISFLLSLAGSAAEPPPKVLRVVFERAETGFDPPQLGDIYSQTVAAHIFEELYGYDHLARPVKLKPVTALGMPEVSADFRTWTIRLKPGIYFTDDPAFKGARRELVAQDYVYSIKRYADPAVKSPQWSFIERLGISGLAALRRAALAAEQPFDYDREIPGLRALDRYTVQFKLDAPRPRLPQSLTLLAVAREVVEAYGARIMEHPVGTGPFKLAEWKRSSRIVLARNPDYRDVHYDAEPAADDAEGQALLAKFKGRRLPMVDRVEIAIIAEDQPRWLAFLNRDFDHITVPPSFVNLAMPGRRLAPYLERQGIRGYMTATQGVWYQYFNMEDPLVGGYTPEKVALRRAIALGVNIERQIDLLRGGQGVVAHSPIGVHMSGFDPAFRSEIGEYDPAKAKALLDIYGYVDRDGDGWRDQPDGRPLMLEQATMSDAAARQFDELMRRDMHALGLRIVFKPALWPENLKAARAGKLMMWQVGFRSGADGQDALNRLYSGSIGGFNYSRFKLAAMDALYERLTALPDGPEREALFLQAKRLAVAYMPEKTISHFIVSDLVQPRLVGYRRPLFWSEWYHMVDIEQERAPARRSTAKAPQPAAAAGAASPSAHTAGSSSRAPSAMQRPNSSGESAAPVADSPNDCRCASSGHSPASRPTPSPRR
jgi:ABC-type transport system substrate-binding protein